MTRPVWRFDEDRRRLPAPSMAAHDAQRSRGLVRVGLRLAPRHLRRLSWRHRLRFVSRQPYGCRWR